MNNRTFTLCLSPWQRLDIQAPDVSVALAVGRDVVANEFLQGEKLVLALTTAYASIPPVSEHPAVAYLLICLHCGQVYRDLVLSQEHLMQIHGFEPEDFRLSLRVHAHSDSTHLLWAVTPERAEELGLSHLCFVRAIKLPENEALYGKEGVYKTLVYKDVVDGSPYVQIVRINSHDANAWYGWPRGNGEGEGEPLIWPFDYWSAATEGGDR